MNPEDIPTRKNTTSTNQTHVMEEDATIGMTDIWKKL